MSDLDDLYQDLILDHGRRPRNVGPLPEANCRASGFNPMCGDQLDLALVVEDGLVREVRFEGKGCAISTASASLMTQALKGKRVEEAEAIYRGFHELLTGQAPVDPEDAEEQLGKLAVFGGVKRFPTRVKCATLAWHTLHAALSGQGEPVSTE